MHISVYRSYLLPVCDEDNIEKVEGPFKVYVKHESVIFSFVKPELIQVSELGGSKFPSIAKVLLNSLN